MSTQMSTSKWNFLFYQDLEVLTMYWDMLTTAGVIISIITSLGAFYLALRERLVVRDQGSRKLDHSLKHHA
jgi:hypothetical protein